MARGGQHCKECMERPQPGGGIKLRTFMLWDNSATHHSTMLLVARIGSRRPTTLIRISGMNGWTKLSNISWLDRKKSKNCSWNVKKCDLRRERLFSNKGSVSGFLLLDMKFSLLFESIRIDNPANINWLTFSVGILSEQLYLPRKGTQEN